MVDLTQLPGELITVICTFLVERRDLQSLRLCCKRLKESSAYAFDGRHFGVMKVTMTRGSLQELINLSREERFQRAIKELEICTVAFSNRTRAPINGRPLSPQETQELEQIATDYSLDPSEYTWPGEQQRNPQPKSRHPAVAEFERALKLKRRKLHDKQMHDQNTMRTKGIDARLLSTALKNLSAIKSIRTTSYTLGLKHSPLAAKELFYEIGVWPFAFRSREEYDVVKTHSISVVFSAVLRSSCQLEKLEFEALPYHLPVAKTTTTRKPTRTSTPSRTFTLDQIIKLDLSTMQSFTFAAFITKDQPAWSPSIPNPLNWLTTLISRMTSLRKLCIRGIDPYVDKGPLRYLVTDELYLPRVHTLELRDLGFKVEEFEQLLSKVERTLESFICVDCWAIDMKNEKILGALGDISLLTYAELHIRSPRKRLQRTINARTPALFRKELDEIIYHYSELSVLGSVE